MSGFVGKNVIVTGSSSGIGEATALMYASEGANVTICGRDAARVQEVVEKCQKVAATAQHKSKFIGVQGEITKPESRTETLKKTVDAFGGLDVLVANHGMATQPPNLESITEDTFNQMFDINVKSVLFLIKEAVPHLEKTKGNIVVTSSVGSYMPNSVGMPYYVAKHAVDHMVRCLAAELGPKGVRINAINPTIVMTRLVTGGDHSGENNPIMAQMMKYASDAHPLEGRVSEPEEQAGTILFLSSEGAKFITGETVKVDGAISLKGNPMAFFFQNMMAQS